MSSNNNKITKTMKQKKQYLQPKSVTVEILTNHPLLDGSSTYPTIIPYILDGGIEGGSGGGFSANPIEEIME